MSFSGNVKREIAEHWGADRNSLLAELAALLDGSSGQGNVRSLFRLGRGVETALYRLGAVESYDAATGQAQCLMLRCTED